VKEGKFPQPIRRVGKTDLYALKDVQRYAARRAKQKRKAKP